MQVKGTEPSYSAWKPPNFRNVFNSRSRHFAAFWAIEITTEFLFVGMAVARVLSKPFAGGVVEQLQSPSSLRHSSNLDFY
jgi:hypothetical protein